jgi:hypothetical protein
MATHAMLDGVLSQLMTFHLAKIKHCPELHAGLVLSMLDTSF